MANPVIVIIVGNALNSFGLTGNDTISGIGLLTFGFLWAADDIWTPAIIETVRNTVWTDCQICGEHDA